MSRFLFNFGVGVHLFAAWGCAAVGGYEAYTNSETRHFSKRNDDLFDASARGLVRGLYYPYKTCTHIPKVWDDENPIGIQLVLNE